MGDLRTRRTYKLLRNALFELLAKKPFDEIKVNDICNIAMIHRTTFYSHFSDKYELLDYCIKGVESELTEKISNNQYTNLRDFYIKLVSSLLQYIGENKKFFKSILVKNYDSGVMGIFTNSCVSYITTMLEKDKSLTSIVSIPIPVVAQFYSGAVRLVAYKQQQIIRRRNL